MKVRKSFSSFGEDAGGTMALQSDGRNRQMSGSGWNMRSLVGLGAACVLALLPSLGRAQGSGALGDEVHFQAAAFKIPFSVPQGAQVYKAKLFVSRDQGTSWNWVADASPEAREFVYTSKDGGDGSYWFAVQTITPNGGAIPPVIQGNNNGQVLRVIVDSRPPIVDLKLMHGPDGTAKADWTIIDEHLRPETISLQYRIPPGNQWYLVNVQNKVAKGDQTWPAGVQPIEVQLTVQDRAGNIGKATATSSPQGTVPLTPGSGSPFPGRPIYSQPETDIRYVNTSRIRLRYNVVEKGKSGISTVEVWRKTIPGTWDTTPLTSKTFNADQTGPEPLDIDLGNVDGLYGLTLVAKSGVNVSLPPPTGNDPPQMTVRVIRTQPEVTINDVLVGKGPTAGRVTITWQAKQKDDLMSRQCITISYAGRDGKWVPLHSGKLDNIGQYTWVVPPNYDDYRISFKVEAEDWAHNVGSAVRENVSLDLTAPRLSPTHIELSPAP
jgi:hypothetical protein